MVPHTSASSQITQITWCCTGVPASQVQCFTDECVSSWTQLVSAGSAYSCWIVLAFLQSINCGMVNNLFKVLAAFTKPHAVVNCPADKHDDPVHTVRNTQRPDTCSSPPVSSNSISHHYHKLQFSRHQQHLTYPVCCVFLCCQLQARVTGGVPQTTSGLRVQLHLRVARPAKQTFGTARMRSVMLRLQGQRFHCSALLSLCHQAARMLGASPLSCEGALQEWLLQ